MEEYLKGIIAYWFLKYFSMRISVAMLLWWMEEKNYKPPTPEELVACREEFLYYLYM